MMRIGRLVSAGLLLGSALTACSHQEVAASEQARPPRFEAGAAAETDAFERSIWNDGKAEIAAYETQVQRYGTLRDGDAVLILVKEAFDAERLVKADAPQPPRYTVPVMKLNHLVTVPTGVYTYRQMASSFLTREDARPVKLAMSSQEWCGTTYKHLEVHGGEATLRAFSYFGAEGERVFDVPLDDRTVLGDALPAWVRTVNLDDRSERDIRIVNRQLSNNAKPPEVSDASFRAGDAEEISVPAGAFHAVPVRVSRGDREETFWLKKKAPHTLVRWDRLEGGVYELRGVNRAPYWKMNDPEDIGALDPRRRPD